MSTLTTAEYLKYANLQMAAEAFIRNEATGELATSADAIVAALIAGNTRSLKFTQPQADAFVDATKGWTVLDQRANTNTGFSGTLFKSNETGELILSFRSTEFIDDHARDNKATNDLEIDGIGFALGQIADMEAWYAQLTAQNGPLAGKTYSVTGYSLGGHLATVFNQLRQAELQAGPPAAILDQVITFNGAGVGQIGNGTLTALIDRFVELRGMANGADGLASLFQTTKGKQAYQALRTAIAANQGIPNDAMRDTVANVFGTLGEGDALLQADRDLLLGANGALTRALKVTAVAVDIPKLSSGDKDSAKPAVITADKIDADGVDYQLAVLTAQAEFNTRSRLTVGDVLSVLTSGGITKEYGEPRLGNQVDAVGWEYSADTPVALVAHSLWHYGEDVRLFIEDQPNVRNGIVSAVANASAAAGDVRLLVEGFATRDFGDDHSLVLIVDSLNVQNTLLNLLPTGQRASVGETLNTILKNASWRKGVDGSNGGESAQGQAEGDVLENIVNALADLFLGPQKKDIRLTGHPDGNTWARIDDKTVGDIKFSGREALYAKLKDIADSDAYKALTASSPNLTLVASTDITAGDARSDFAKFAALYSLSPFVLSGQALEAQIKSAWETTFDDWNADKTNAAGATLTFSESWMADRAEFLKRKNWFNAANLNPFDPAYQMNSSGDAYRNEDSYYWDLASDYRIAQGQVSGATRRYFFGDERGNVLDGRAANGNSVTDHLYGMAGQDVLIGGGGNDRLDGGRGYDSYVRNSDDGDDTILDLDRKGRILINGSAAKLLVKKTDTTWLSPDGKLTLTQPADSSSGWKLSIDGGGSLDLGTSFTDGDFGLHRQDAPAAVPTTVTIEGDKAPKEFTANFSGPINPASHGPGWHNPVITITAEHTDPEDPNKTIVDSYKVTYNTKDALGNYVTDGAAPDRDDTLFGHASQADYIQSGGGADVIDARGGHDRVQAGSGGDRVASGAGDDLVEGGAGADILFGEADADILWGDTAASGSTPIAGAIANAISTTDTEASQAITGDWLDGGVGNDVLIGGAAKDVLLAGLENDLLIGGAGDDLLLGDGWTTTGPSPGWSPLRQVSTNSDTHVTSYTASFQGANALWPTTGGGADMLYGGAGDDWLFAGGGDDVLDGGTGQDVLLGEAGNDVVRGGAGNDVVSGDDANTPEALQGHDWLEGGEGNDTLTGLGGDDVLIGGRGDDTMAGGAGRDTYIIAKGEGTDTIIDTDAGADKSNFVFGEGVRSEDITLRLGSLLLDLGGGDAVHIEGFDRTRPLDNELGSFSFADGSTLSWKEMLARGFDLDGTESDDTIFGTGIEDRIDGKAGNDLIWGGDGNDVLTGGTGTDGLNGGLGDDVYVFGAGDAATMDGTATGVAETLADEGGTDTIRFAAGVDPQQIVLLDNLDSSLVIDFSAPEQTLDRLLVADGLSGAIERFEVGAGDTARSYSYTQFVGEFGDGIYRGTDADGHEHASGGRGSDDVGVSGGGNHVSGGKGNDTVRAFGLNNTIHYSAGDGTDTVWTNVSGNPGNVLRLSGIDASQLRLGLDASRHLVVTAGENADDRMVFQRFDANAVLATRPFDTLAFDDESQLSYEALMRVGIDVKGTDEEEILVGTDVDDRIDGAAGGDWLWGYLGDDVISGGSGNDLLIGGEGNDTYVFEAGDGMDTVVDRDGFNTVRFGTGLLREAMSASQALGDDGERYLDLDFGNGDRLSIRDGELDKVQLLVFADGSLLSTADLLASMPSVDLLGEAGADLLNGYAGADTLAGAGGDDSLAGGGGNDVLFGGSGKDSIGGGEGDDYLDGGAGDDTLAGGLGTDTYVFAPGAGHETIVESGADLSILRLGPGATERNLRPVRDGDDLVLGHANQVDTLRIQDFYVDATTGDRWDVLREDGTRIGMTGFLAVAGQGIAAVSAVIAAYRDSVRADWSELFIRQGYSLQADGSWRLTTTNLAGTALNLTIQSSDWTRRVGFESVSLDGGQYGQAALLVRDEFNDVSTLESVEVVTRRPVLATQHVPIQPPAPDQPYFVPHVRRAGEFGQSYMIPSGATFNLVADHGPGTRPYVPGPWDDGSSMYVANTGRFRGIWIHPPQSGTGSSSQGGTPGDTTSATTIRVSGTQQTVVQELLLSEYGDTAYGVGHGVIDGGAGNDELHAVFYTEFPDYSTEVFALHGGAVLYGNDGNDYLFGADGDNILIGGRGRDVLTGGGGADTFMLLEEDSVDYITDTGSALGYRIDWRNEGELIFANPELFSIAGNDHAALEAYYGSDILPDTLIFGAGTSASLVSVFMSDSPQENQGPWYEPVLQIMTAEGTGAQITLARAEDEAGTGIEYVQFGDGTRQSIGQVLARRDQSQNVLGTLGRDVIRTGAGNDRIDGGANGDLLAGGVGNDTYVIGRSTGFDTIDQGNALPGDADVIEFAADVAPADVALSMDETGLNLRIVGYGSGAKLLAWTGNDSNLSVSFSDGTVWDAATLQSLLATVRGSTGADSLIGTGGNDILLGYEGGDSLNAGGGDDLLDGGPGNDILMGGAGDDTYLFGRSSGSDFILASGSLVSDRDVVRLDPGIAPADVFLSRQSFGVLLALDGSAATLSIGNGLSIPSIQFADGTVWDAAVLNAVPILGTALAETLAGGNVGETLLGVGGNDYLFGHGGDDVLDGGAGDDLLDGGSGNDVYLFGLGSGHDHIQQYSASIGDLDRIRFGAGIAASDVTAIRDSFGLHFTLVDSGETLDAGLPNGAMFASVEFADGTVWDSTSLAALPITLQGSAVTDNLVGTLGNDRILGLAGDDRLYGEAGDDLLLGGDGDDLLFGGDGNDELQGGRGADLLYGGPGATKLRFDRGDGADQVFPGALDATIGYTLSFGAGVTSSEIRVTKDSSFLAVSIEGSGDSVSFYQGNGVLLPAVEFESGAYWSPQYVDYLLHTVGTAGSDELVGGGGADVLQGFAGNDELRGQGGVDTLVGGAGSDRLDGGAGNDIYLYSRGDGSDTLVLSGNGEDEIDTLRFAAGIDPGDVAVFANEEGGESLIIGLGSAGGEGGEGEAPRDRITLQDWFEVGSRGLRVEFGDGTVWDAATLTEMGTPPVREIVGTAGDDEIGGSEAREVIHGLAGDDELYGGGGDDTLTGGTGNDYISGGSGHDVIDFARGDGWDELRVYESPADSDIIRMGEGIRQEDVVVGRRGDDLLLLLADGDEGISVRWWFEYPTGLASVEFQDGSHWDAASLAEMADESELIFGSAWGDELFGTRYDDHIIGLGGNDVLEGYAGNDILIGGTGNDVAFGGGGDDFLVGGSGVDSLWGGEGADTYLYRLGDGWDEINSWALSGEDESPVGGDTIRFGLGILPGGVSVAARQFDGEVVIELEAGGGDGGEGGGGGLRVFGDLDYLPSVSFADGTVISPEQLLDLAAAWVGSEDSDVLIGTAADDHILAGAGEDVLYGRDGDDVLAGGADFDRLRGGRGDDVYLFGLGDGEDIIDTRDGGADVIRFGAGVSAGDLTFGDYNEGEGYRIGNLETDDTIAVLADAASLPAVEFADGTTWTRDELLAKFWSHAPMLEDEIQAQSAVAGETFELAVDADLFWDPDQWAGDTLSYQAMLADGSPLPGWLGFDAESLSFSGMPGSGDGGELDVHLVATDRAGNSVAAGFTLSVDGGNTAPVVLAPPANQNATENLPFLWSLPSNTFANADVGDELTYTVTLANGDPLPAWLGFDASANRLVGTPGSGTHGSIELTVRATDRGGLTAEASFTVSIGPHLRGSGSSDTLDYSASSFTGVAMIDGGAGNDAITGSFGADVIVGGTGSDNLNGGAGDDVFLLSGTDAGYDRIEGGAGFDILRGSNGDDTFRMYQFTGAATVERIDGNGGNDVVAGTGSSDTLDFSATELVGIAQIDGGSGNDAITGSFGADVIVGGTGSDNLNGGAGDDVFLLSGTDAGYDRFEGGAGFDVLQGSAGDDTFRMYQFTGAATVERIDGNGGNDVVAGTGSSDTLDFSATELVGISQIDGGSGNDAITGSAGADIIVGGTGSDRLKGGLGSDTYRFGRGDGVDTVAENDATVGNADAAEFLAGIAADQIWMRHVGNNLEASIIGTTDKLIVENWYLGSEYRLEQFRTADGRVLLDSQVENLVQAMAAFAPPAAGQTTLPQAYQDALAPAIAANWQ